MVLDDEVRMTLRLPIQLRERLTESAAFNSRSMNGEIVQRLSQTYWHQTNMFPELGEEKPRYPAINNHELLSKEELIEAIDRYTQNMQDCVRVLQRKNEEDRA